jgi:diaminopimelate decarboxylase
MPPSGAPDPRLRLDEATARELAREYGTPLYVLDERGLRARIRRYRSASLDANPKAELSYASKANSTLAVLAIAHSEGCLIDVASEGELRAAMAAGVPAARCHFHGNNKSPEELAFGVDVGVGAIVVDHFGEIDALADFRPQLRETRLVLRLAPGVDPITHAKISTGQADTKFGFNIADGSAERAVRRCLEAELPLAGFHCHVGSQLLDPRAQQSGGELIARFAADMKARTGFTAEYLNVGGGLGVRYTEGEAPMAIEEYCRLVADAVRRALEGTGLDPVLAQEPGRALVAESGVTLYRVGVIKTVPAKERGRRTYVGVDGGLSDNPRPALYGSQYAVERVARAEAPAPPADRERKVTVSGKHCETDMLFEDVALPEDLSEGDLVQVLATGAYNASMASNYNRFPRPATALLREDGGHVLVQRRETWDEMFARDIVPEELRRPWAT